VTVNEQTPKETAFETAAHAQWDRATALQRDTAQAIVDLLAQTQQRLAALLADQPTDWQQWALPALRKQVELYLSEFAAAAGQNLGQAAEIAHDVGQAMVDAPLAAGPDKAGHGVELQVFLPRLDRRQLIATQHFMTSKLSDVSAAAARRINTELGLVVTGLSTPSQAATAVQAALDGAPRRRALTIARTELGRVFSSATQGRMEQAQRKGVLGLKKKWRRSGKLHSRHSHDLADGQVVDVDKPFVVGGEELMFPRDPKASAANTVNCGCVHLPHMDHWRVSLPAEKPFTAEELAASPEKRDIEEIRQRATRLHLRSSGGGSGQDLRWRSTPAPPLVAEDLALRREVLAAGSAEGAVGEYLAARDARTGQVWPIVTSGNRERVDIPSDLWSALTNPKSQVILHHNHPDSGSLSGQDVAVALANAGCAAAYAHGHDGTTYAVRPGLSGHKSDFRMLEMVARTTVGRQLERQVQKGRLWPNEVASYRRHAINEALARAGVIDYTVSWSPDVEPEWANLKETFEAAIAAGSDMVKGHLKDA